MRRDGPGKILLLLAALAIGASAQALPSPSLRQPTTPEKNLKVFDRMWETVNRKYFDAGFNGRDWNAVRSRYRPIAARAATTDALQRTLQSAVDELKTSHLSVWRQVQVSGRKLNRQLNQNVDWKHDAVEIGFGLMIRRLGAEHAVFQVVDGSPAARAGIKVGWVVTHSDGKPYDHERSLEDVMEEDANTWRLRLLDETGAAREVTLESDWIVRRPEREARLLEGDIALLRIDSFSADADKWFEQNLARYRRARGLVLDLRGNPGGYLSVLRKILTPLYARETRFGEFIKRDRDDRALRTNGAKNRAYVGPLAVLVDDASGSCAEIFAAAIQDTGRGKIVGRRTAGFVLASQTETLPADFRLRIAIWDYRTANGQRLEGQGVVPDFRVRYTLDDLRQRRDPDLEQALQWLKNAPAFVFERETLLRKKP